MVILVSFADVFGGVAVTGEMDSARALFVEGLAEVFGGAVDFVNGYFDLATLNRLLNMMILFTIRQRI